MSKNDSNELKLRRDLVFNERPPLPRNMLIELTNICNHQCIFCNYKNMQREKRFCDKDFTKRIISDAYSEGVRDIGFHLIGEPFAYKDLPEFIAYCKEIGFTYVYITSNGALATPERMKEAVDAGLDSIKFSVNAASKETYAKIHGRDDFSTVKENVIWLRNYLDSNKIPLKTFLSFIKCNYNKNEINLLHEQFDNLVDKVYIFNCVNFSGYMPKMVKDGIIDEFPPIPVPCPEAFKTIHVTVEGFLDACCADTDGLLVVADLHKMSLKDAWNSDVFVNLRRQHLEKRLENNLCKCCVQNLEPNVQPLIEI